MALVSQLIAVALLYGQLTKAANMEGGDSLSIAGAKRNIVIAVKSSKEWVQVFEMYMRFETDEESNPLSETKIIGDMNESGRSLEVLLEACENAKVLTRLAGGMIVTGHGRGRQDIRSRKDERSQKKKKTRKRSTTKSKPTCP